jgi:hypothetical protein
MARHSTVLPLLLAVIALLAAPALADEISDALDAALASIADASSIAATATSAARASATSSASGPYGGVDSKFCGTLSELDSSASANGNGCSVYQKISACNGKLSTVAKINGKTSTCCVVMINYKAGNLPTLFCGQPAKKGQFWQFSSDAKVSVSPSCSSSNGAGSFSCSVTFDKLPDSYVQPPVTDSSKPYTTSKFNPCGGRYTKFSQVANKKEGGPVTITAKCS